MNEKSQWFHVTENPVHKGMYEVQLNNGDVQKREWNGCKWSLAFNFIWWRGIVK